MSTAVYKGRTIKKTSRGYIVDDEVFRTLEAATDFIDWS
jgi:hypothetical protein